MPDSYAVQAIQAVLNSRKAYCKFLSANDTGLTGGHQAGIYISKPSVPILFDEPGIRGENREKWVKVKWQDEIETDTRLFITVREQGMNTELLISAGDFLFCDRNIPVLCSSLQNAVMSIIRRIS